MSALLLTFILKAAVAINIADLGPTQMAELEAAVLAKYNVSLDDTDKAEDAESKAKVSDLEAAVLAKYNVTLDDDSKPSGDETKPKVEEVGSAVSSGDNAKPKEVETTPKVSDLEAAVLAKYNVTLDDESKPTVDETKPKVEEVGSAVSSGDNAKPKEVETTPKLSDLEAAVLAKYNVTLDDESKPAGGETKPKVEEVGSAASTGDNAKSKEVETTPKVSDLEAAVLAKYNVTLDDESKPTGDETKPKDAEVGSAASSGDNAKPKEVEATPKVEDIEAAVLAKYNVTLDDESKPSAGKLKLKANDVTESKVEDLEAAVQAKYNVSSEAESKNETNSSTKAVPEAKKAAAKHYRNHGAAMHHVEPAKPAKQIASQSEDAEAAARIAKKRAEVEEIFHLNKKNKQTSQDTKMETSANSGFSLLRGFVFLAAVISIAVFAHHKYQVILEISDRKGADLFMRSFKAKQEDDDYFGAPSGHGQSMPNTFVSSMMEGGRQRLSFRSGGDAMRSCEFGV